MSDYRVLPGANQALLDLVRMTPQPRSAGVQFTRRTNSASGVLYQEAPYIELQWAYFETPTEYNTLLTQFGLDSIDWATVTIYAPNERYAYTRYQGMAILPPASQNNFFIRDVTILVRDLQAL